MKKINDDENYYESEYDDLSEIESEYISCEEEDCVCYWEGVCDVELAIKLVLDTTRCPNALSIKVDEEEEE